MLCEGLGGGGVLLAFGFRNGILVGLGVGAVVGKARSIEGGT